jgi:arylsulfatase A-like enzyme
MENVTPEEIRRSRAAYYGMVEEMDAQIGRLMEAVDPERDLFLYTSDHGDMAGEHGMFWKSCFLDGAVKVPMIWRGSGVQPGRVVSGLVSLLDAAPTFAEAAEAEGLPGAEGHSLLAALGGEGIPAERTVVSMLLDGRSGPSCMVRTEGGCRIHHSRFTDEVKGVDPGVPTGWNDDGMEKVLTQVSRRGGLLRRAFEAADEPVQERWQVDSAVFYRE